MQSFLGLAVFDSIVIATVLLLKGMPSIVESSYQVYFFQFLYPCMNIAWTASIFLTVLMSFERFLGICHQNAAKNFCTRKKMMIYILAIFIFSCVYNIPRFNEYELVDILARTEYDPELKEYTWNRVPSDDVIWHQKAFSNVTVVKETDLLSNNLYVTVYLTWLNFLVRFLVPTILLAFFNMKIVLEVIFSSNLD